MIGTKAIASYFLGAPGLWKWGCGAFWLLHKHLDDSYILRNKQEIMIFTHVQKKYFRFKKNIRDIWKFYRNSFSIKIIQWQK